MERFVWIDIVKTICIICMVIGHCGSFGSNLIHDTIYSFHMPLFFIVSGFLWKPHGLLYDFKRLLLPMLLSIPIIIAVDVFVLKSLSIHGGLSKINWNPFSVFLIVINGSWFVVTLFLCRSIVNIIRNNWCLAFVSLLFIILYEVDGLYSIFHGLTYKQFVCSFPFFFIGILFNKLSNNWVNVTFALVAVGSIIALYIWNGTNEMVYGNAGHHLFVTIIYNLLLAILFRFVFNNCSIPSFITTLSNGTLLILICNHSLIELSKKLFAVSNPIIQTSVSLTFTIMICYVLIKLCDKYCPYFLGKIKK